MKKSIILLFGLCLFSLLTCFIQANNPKPVFLIQTSNSVPHGYEEVELKGDLAYSAGPNAIEAGVNENSVYIQFNQDFGYVNVTIYNPNGQLIYNDVVNTSVQQLLVIPLTNYNEGIYTIILESAFGYAEGEFEKD